MLDCRGFDGRFPLRAANGRLTKARLLTLAKRAEACGGNRARALLHPTGNLAGALRLAWRAVGMLDRCLLG